MRSTDKWHSVYGVLGNAAMCSNSIREIEGFVRSIERMPTHSEKSRFISRTIALHDPVFYDVKSNLIATGLY